MDEINTEGISPQKKSKISLSKILILLLVLSIALNAFLLSGLNNAENLISGQSFKLIKPNELQPIDSDTQNNTPILHYQGLKEILSSDISQYNATVKIGVYIQDAKTGAWLGINEKEGFSPASLLKVPIMIAILKKVDRNEIKLEDKINVVSGDIDNLYSLPYETLKEGSQISISELLRRMIVLSDNTAKNALKRQLSMDELDSVFIHVGIPDPYALPNNHTVSPRDYSRLFKALYYSTYLSQKLSNMALDLTTDTQEENLISKGVPPEIQVAHKFGVLENESLHDCGIVYHPVNPYFICLMTKGLSLENSSELIYKISKDTFEFVDSKSK